MGETKAQRERRRANRKKYLKPQIFKLPDLTPTNAFKVMNARRLAEDVRLGGNNFDELDYIQL